MINEKEYKKRREKVASGLKNNSIVLLLSATPKTRSNDTEYPYRQNSNFYYLTGFKEDSAAMVMLKTAKELKTYLFVAKKDKALELWTGKRVGVKRAKKIYDFDGVYEYGELEAVMKENIVKKNSFYYDFCEENAAIKRYKELCKNIRNHRDIAKKINLLRLIKSDAEIELIKKALEITKEAHHKAMKEVSRLKNEYELLAEIEYVFKKNGAYSDAYTSIVASANAANTLHYISNDKPIQKNELVLIDAGCEYEYYASDITRTIPASKRYSPAQKELYELVLSVEKEIIGMVKPGVYKSQLQSRSEALLCEGMLRLGILKGKKKKILKKRKHKKYYPHGIGHWMGIDVHDQAPYKNKKEKEIAFEAGMVLTIEPGLYFDENDTKVPKKYRGIGIRIEDNILVTTKGHENLSEDIKKEIDEVENYDD